MFNKDSLITALEFIGLVAGALLAVSVLSANVGESPSTAAENWGQTPHKNQ